MSNEIVKKQNWQMTPTSLDEAMKFAELIAKSDLVPKDYKDKPANCLIAMQMGAEVGLSPMQAIQSIAIINGRPCIWGDAMLGLCQVHPDFEWIKEEFNEKGDATCTVKRKGYPEHTQVFGVKDVVQAGYDKKQGPWQTSRARMIQLRARSFALRNTFADAIKGLSSAEETMDTVEVEQVTVTDTTKSKTQSLKDKLKELPSSTVESSVVVNDAPEIVEPIETSSDESKAPDDVIEGEIIEHEANPEPEQAQAKKSKPAKSAVEEAIREEFGAQDGDRLITHAEWNKALEHFTAKGIAAREVLNGLGLKQPKDLKYSQYLEIMK